MAKFKLYLIIGFTILTALSAIGQYTSEDNSYPYNSNLYLEINDNRDEVLQRNLEKFIFSNKKWKKLVAQKRMSVGLVDLRQEQQVRYASINGDYMMYAASLPKIAVLLAAMESVEEECLAYNDALKKDLRLMIAKSNNAATTRVIERLGYDKIAEVMMKDEYNLYDKSNGGGLWVGKKYAKSGHKKPDPLKGLSHAATVDQVCRFYTMLAYGKLVNPEMNAEMMKYLKDPEINHKFVNVLSRIAPNADLYRKSGSWRTFHSDSVLVEGENGRKYILVTLIDSPAGGAICKHLVKQAEKALGLDKKDAPDIQIATPNVPVLKPNSSGS